MRIGRAKRAKTFAAHAQSRYALRPAKLPRRLAREAEGAPLLREYRVKSLIEGSNPSLSAKSSP
jgi:hypothetical protein